MRPTIAMSLVTISGPAHEASSRNKETGRSMTSGPGATFVAERGLPQLLRRPRHRSRCVGVRPGLLRQNLPGEDLQAGDLAPLAARTFAAPEAVQLVDEHPGEQAVGEQG